MNSTIAFAVVAAASLASGAASAAPPADLEDTTWTVQVDGHADQLVITDQYGPGGPGGSTCLKITGEIGIAPIQGIYCPSSGNIQFLHRNLFSGVTVRVFTGKVLDAVLDQPLSMEGTMTTLNEGFGPFGFFEFSATE